MTQHVDNSSMSSYGTIDLEQLKLPTSSTEEEPQPRQDPITHCVAPFEQACWVVWIFLVVLTMVILLNSSLWHDRGFLAAVFLLPSEQHHFGDQDSP